MRSYFFLVVLLLSRLLVTGQPDSQQYDSLLRLDDALVKKEDYKQAAMVRSIAMRLAGHTPTNAERYSIACRWSLAGTPDSAFGQLFDYAKAADLSFDDVNDILTDSDLDTLHREPRWQEMKNKMFIQSYKNFINLQESVGINVNRGASTAEVLTWASALSMDSLLHHLNDPAKTLLKQGELKKAELFIRTSLNDYPRKYYTNRDMGNYYLAIKDSVRSFVYHARALFWKYWLSVNDTEKSKTFETDLYKDHQHISRLTGHPSSPTESLIAFAVTQFLRKGSTERAFELAKKNLEDHPGGFRAHQTMSEYYKKMGDGVKADNYTMRSLLLQFNLPDDFFSPGFKTSEYILSRYETLAERMGFKINPPVPMLTAMGNYFLNKKNTEAARLVFDMATSLYPDHPVVLNAAGRFYRSAGDTARGIELEKKARILSRDPLFVAYVPVADTSYDIKVNNPVCTENCPVILFDEAHNNYHTATGRYLPFANLMRNDGFTVSRGQTPFSKQSLTKVNVVVIVSPNVPTGVIPKKEITVLNEWVKAGGSLLMITDHDNERIYSVLESFGVISPDVTYTCDTLHGNFNISFFDSDHRLGDHPIINGRNESEKIHRVQTFTGRTIIGPPGSAILLPLGPSTTDYLQVDPFMRAMNEMVPVKVQGLRSHGVAFRFGKGKVVTLSEAAQLSAQIFPQDASKTGMNVTGSDNRQFALNIMRWLTGYLD
ncbi:MAG TPA: hypothetical protein VMZ03_04775 [Chitinophagaceae bacterium]|nr:hypothetical protein [Chitinophagaceae bacterium]